MVTVTRRILNLAQDSQKNSTSVFDIVQKTSESSQVITDDITKICNVPVMFQLKL
jgi:hypothetical protein